MVIVEYAARLLQQHILLKIIIVSYYGLEGYSPSNAII